MKGFAVHLSESGFTGFTGFEDEED